MDRTERFYKMQREGVHLLLIEDARRGLEDIVAGRTQDADAAIAKLEQHRARAVTATRPAKRRG